MEWSKAVLPKCRGGIGIKKLKLVNHALHCKWIWRYGNEKRALWRQIVHQKFGGILKARDHVKKHTSLIVKNGESMLFWKDKWLGNHVLQISFPALFKLSRKKDATVLHVANGNGAWDLDFKRNLNEAEVGEVAQLLQLMLNL